MADLSVSDYFRIFDENGDGNIDVWELQRGLSAGLGLAQAPPPRPRVGRREARCRWPPPHGSISNPVVHLHHE